MARKYEIDGKVYDVPDGLDFAQMKQKIRFLDFRGIETPPLLDFEVSKFLLFSGLPAL